MSIKIPIDNSKKYTKNIIICSKSTDIKNFTAIDYLCAGFGLSISNRLADWFFGNKKSIETQCIIDKKIFVNCMKDDMSQCIKFMKLLKKCKCDI